ncbi:MAG: YlxM family DNA-binding protein [Clostridiales bacterium]
MIEKRNQIAFLYDFYQGLLTEKQRQAMALFYEEDLSLGEIAQYFSVSRQAVYDMLKRSEALLEHYESSLALGAKYLQRTALEKQLSHIAKILQNNPDQELWQKYWLIWQEIKEGD